MIERFILAAGVFAACCIVITIPFDELRAAQAKCDCDYEAEKVSRSHARAWMKVVDGVRLDDTELQALADAQDIVECVATKSRETKK